ncbi:putative ADP-ribosylation factor GTPase-activating protein AGD6 [Iris pallida]|uniref:ADP-ribosylation factor GTPase-activating protein AGD6 n=1 Tax=Iris pallida TaxID=29817 RepID=A0AAX6DWJ5_IRIPA|nr:putative ADP-ribosylation factor GTPase-activating protein AGD6 [Iris pallida]
MSSWDDWNEKERKNPPAREDTESGDTWAGWDDVKMMVTTITLTTRQMQTTRSGKSDSSSWTEGGFR